MWRRRCYFNIPILGKLQFFIFIFFSTRAILFLSWAMWTLKRLENGLFTNHCSASVVFPFQLMNTFLGKKPKGMQPIYTWVVKLFRLHFRKVNALLAPALVFLYFIYFYFLGNRLDIPTGCTKKITGI